MTETLPNRIARALAAFALEGQAGGRSRVRALARYALLGAVALSILPAAAAGAPFALAQDGADSKDQARSHSTADRQTQEEVAKSSADESETKAAPRVNALPLKELVARVGGMVRSGELDLSRPAEATVETNINADGTLSNTRVSAASGDTISALAQDFARALDESRFFAPFKGMSRAEMRLVLDGETVLLRAAAEVESEKRAHEWAVGYGAILKIARLNNSNPEKVAVLNNMTVSASGKQFVMKLEMTREAAGNLLLKQVTPN